ncbi:Wzz/FepE/Etk N-terminal domain-containing protein [Paraburkholderia diazotrophica]|uniref:Wzz/FepE/Etk N-terminal domain-containing protein n=1 Tax=Paraburkholderia diazotrophica TaxID=667676 RepID=UPI00316FEF77
MNDMQLNSISAPTAARKSTLFAEQNIDVIEVLVTLGEQKWRLLCKTVIGAMLGVAISFALPPLYTSNTVLLPPQQQKGGLSAMAELGALSELGGAVGIKTPDEMYVGLLKSDTVADDLIKRFNLRQRYDEKLMRDVRERLKRNVLITSDKKTGFITIEASDRVPEFAAQLANAYVDELRLAVDRLAVTDAQQRRVFFQQQIAKTLDRLSEAEIAFDEARRKSGVVSLDGQVANTIRTSAELRARIAATEIELQAMRTYETDENADVQRALATIEAMRGQLQALEQGGNDGAQGAANRDSSALANIRAYREVKYQEAMLDQLRKQLALAQVDEAKEGPLVQQIDVAVAPEKKSWPKRWLFGALAGLLGLLIGVAPVVIRHALQKNQHLLGDVIRLSRAWRLKR